MTAESRRGNGCCDERRRAVSRSEIFPATKIAFIYGGTERMCRLTRQRAHARVELHARHTPALDFPRVGARIYARFRWTNKHARKRRASSQMPTASSENVSTVAARRSGCQQAACRVSPTEMLLHTCGARVDRADLFLHQTTAN